MDPLARRQESIVVCTVELHHLFVRPERIPQCRPITYPCTNKWLHEMTVIEYERISVSALLSPPPRTVGFGRSARRSLNFGAPAGECCCVALQCVRRMVPTLPAAPVRSTRGRAGPGSASPCIAPWASTHASLGCVEVSIHRARGNAARSTSRAPRFPRAPRLPPAQHQHYI